MLTGGAAAAVNVLSRVGFSLVLRFELAVLAAYAVGMVTAYILARRFVFTGSGQSIRRSFAAFALVNLVAVLQTWLVSIGLRHVLLPIIGAATLVDLIAHSVGVAIPVFTSYLGHKHVSFRTPEQ
ncbi:MAG: GtrA family protein [Synechococcaceae cyanobacterium]